MAVGLIFQFGTEYVEVRINGNHVLFRTAQTMGMFATIDNIKLNYNGVVKEHPDLKDKDNWNEEAIKRFKDKIKSMTSEMEKVKYIRNDLQKFGYVPVVMQREGFRPEKL
jgi:GTP1/Obg family GTP-binding protein